MALPGQPCAGQARIQLWQQFPPQKSLLENSTNFRGQLRKFVALPRPLSCPENVRGRESGRERKRGVGGRQGDLYNAHVLIYAMKSRESGYEMQANYIVHCVHTHRHTHTKTHTQAHTQK